MTKHSLPTAPGPIGVFDSGYGGLTILKEMRRRLPHYDYLYLGDNARAPYGARSFDVVYQFTLEAVRALFERGCHLVILACNTASAKALRSIQQCDLPNLDPQRRVLGVIRPTVEAAGRFSANGRIGVLATPGTIRSRSYDLEIAKLYPEFVTTGHACPLWAALVENGEADGPGADYFVERDINSLLGEAPDIDTIVLACTHYPLLLKKIRRYAPANVNIVTQGAIVADSLADYMERHPEIDALTTRGGSARFLTTENPETFTGLAELFLGTPVEATHITLR